jgi:transcription-repair coupling factor (superfamily II helicase)
MELKTTPNLDPINITGLPSLQGVLSKTPLQILGASEAQAQLSALVAIQNHRQTLIIVPTFKELSPWIQFFDQNSPTLAQLKIATAVLPSWTTWGSDRFVNQTLLRWQRLDALSKLSDQVSSCCILTTLHGLCQKTMSLDTMRQHTVTLRVHDQLDQDDLILRLKEAGYLSASIVDSEGLFSVRGSIIDIFPPSSLLPVRCEFFGDKIESLRSFSIDDQRSRNHLDILSIGPASETPLSHAERKSAAQRIHDFLLLHDQTPQSDRAATMDAFLNSHRNPILEVVAPLIRHSNVSALDHIGENACFFFPKGLQNSLNEWNTSLNEYERSYKSDQLAYRITAAPEVFFDCRNISNIINEKSPHIIELEAGQTLSSHNTASFKRSTDFVGVSSTLPAAAKFDQWIETIRNLIQLDHAEVFLLTTNIEQRDRIALLFENRDIQAKVSDTGIGELFQPNRISTSQINLSLGYLSDYVWLPEDKRLLLPEHLLFGVVRKKTRSGSSRLKNYLSSFRDLKVEDLVVHTIHGIGRYKGMVTMTIAGVTADFLHLEYAGGDKVYLPVDKLNMLQRYSSGSESDHHAHVDRLGGGGWDKRKERVKQAIKEMAEKLLKIQAQRALAPSHVYAKADDDYFKFESEFPYEETNDQRKAIEEVNADLETSKQMDRLICGDVGFGKTEVALRAAYRAVHEGFQVLVLVPTTILCYQHYRSFLDRMGRHGIRVAQLNRFVSSKIESEVLESFSNSKIDVLIGTHKILSQSIRPRRLGLIVIDEEQKFGVTHKERLKELKANADILTLTATPIPRTLHMAMLGLRDISIIATPPPNRLSVKTFVSKFDETLIKEAITLELERGGQVFFVHNRVDDIEEMAAFIKSLVPKAAARTAHGQMREQILEQTIIDFIEHKFDILVCTTIIESGVDMPNVNTLIINNADRYGLSQLYQMRGRVGRSSLQAYAYLFTKDPSHITDDARKRLDVLCAHQSLGSGFQIASHDLEIRGAGNLLGADQSGHAAEVGLEMYTDMLEEAICELRGQSNPNTRIDAEIKIPISARLPSSFIAAEDLRLQLYKQLFSATTLAEIDGLITETKDRFGEPPTEVVQLFLVAKVKLQLSSMGASQVSLDKAKSIFEVRFSSLSENKIDQIIRIVQKDPKTYRLSPDYKLFVYWNQSRVQLAVAQVDDMTLLTELKNLLSPFAAEMELSPK